MKQKVFAVGYKFFFKVILKILSKNQNQAHAGIEEQKSGRRLVSYSD